MKYIPVDFRVPTDSKVSSSWIGIETYWGKVGDGKTHHVVKYRLLPALAQGRIVYTNIDFGKDLYLADGTLFLKGSYHASWLVSNYLGKDVRRIFNIVSNDFFRSNLLLQTLDGAQLKIKPHSRIIIDEAQMLFPISGYQLVDPAFFRLLTYCRHYDIDFVFITQNPNLLDKRIISSSTELIMIKNLWFLSTFAKNVYQESHHQTIWAESHLKSRHTFDKTIFSLYKSADFSITRQRRFLPAWVFLPFFFFVGSIIWIFTHPQSVMYRKIFGEKAKNASEIRSTLPQDGFLKLPPSLSTLPMQITNQSDSRPSAVSDFWSKVPSDFKDAPSAPKPHTLFFVNTQGVSSKITTVPLESPPSMGGGSRGSAPNGAALLDNSLIHI